MIRLSFFCEGHPSLEEYMSLASFSRVAVLSSIVAVGFVGVGAIPAQAASSCPTGATLISPTICQITFTEDGTFPVPSGVSKLTAVLVGGGGGAYVFDGQGAGGGGGVVTYADNLDLSGSVSVVVGAGGAPSEVAGGVSSADSASAPGGFAGTGKPGELPTGGASGANNGANLVADDGGGTGGAGGGAKASPAEKSASAGIGYFFSEIPGVDPALWPASSDRTTAVAAGGFGQIKGEPVEPPTVANYGDGGSVFDGRQAGTNGVVIFRFAATPAAEIANTGVATTGGLLLPIALIVAGASFVALRSKKLFTLKKS
jgi:hypothetical protein